MNDLDLATEYKLSIAKLRNELETKEYGGQTGLEFAQRCSKESTIALMYGLTEEADLILDIMDAALAQHMRGDV
jgi:hypothetical protein